MDFKKEFIEEKEPLDENIEDLNKDELFDEKELELEPEKEEPEEQTKGGTKSANDPEPVYFEKFDDALISDGQGGYTNLGEAVYAKDSGGRTEINELRNLVDNTDGAVHYKGTTTTALTNGSTTNPITIDGESYTAVFGDIVVYNYTEFIFDGTQWSEFGRPFAVGVDDVVLWTGDKTSAPDTIILSEAYTNFNELIFESVYVGGSNDTYESKSYKTSDISLNDIVRFWYNDDTIYCNYLIVSSTQFTKQSISGSAKPYKIIGRRYAELNPDLTYTETTLFTNPNVDFPSTINLSDNYTKYDELVFYVKGTDSTDRACVSILTSLIESGKWYNISSTANVNGWVSFTSGTQLAKEYSTTGFALLKIVGVNHGKYTAISENYSTTEHNIGTWIDGSDLYQRTFEVTELTNGQWNTSILGTSGINIVDVEGWIDWTYNGEPNCRTNLNYYANSSDYVSLANTYTDLDVKPNRTDAGMQITEAVITIKYTKPSVQANLM